MNPWFEEKASQIDSPSMHAFGISITTRHSKARELAELLMFAQEAAQSNVNHLVEAAFYDSNSQCCTFEFRKGLSSSPLTRELSSRQQRRLSPNSSGSKRCIIEARNSK